MSHTHFIGIGGTGLSAIARVLLESGQQVSGSDRALSPLAAALRADGVMVYEGHDAVNVQGADVVVRSSAIPDTNVEVQAARALGLPVLKRSDFLGKMMDGRTGIAIAGTHGKTTTTSMIAWMLTALGLDPTYISGGVIANLGTNAHAGQGVPFVIEADEYDRMFLGLRPKIAIVTNVEHDHPDCYPTSEDFFQAFRDFVKTLSLDGTLIACVDDPGASSLLHAEESGPRGFPYGLTASARVRGGNLAPQPGAGFQFDLYLDNEFQTHVALQVPGQHNVLNALAALSVAHLLGLSLPDAALALGKFCGAGRRFDLRGEAGEVLIIDDYAHHPTEIRATLAAARARYPSRTLWAVWQPHTYSRTETLRTEFARAFGDADHVLVTGVYAARETAPAGFSLQPLLDAMPNPDVHHFPTLDEVSAYLVTHLHPNDVLLVMSAGDAEQVSQQVFSALSSPNVRASLGPIGTQRNS